MKSIRRFVGIGAVCVFAVFIGRVTVWGQECAPIQVLGIEPSTWYDAPLPEEVLTLVRLCHEDLIDQLDFCWVYQNIGEYSGTAVGCGNYTWGMEDPFGVGYSGWLWRNPGVFTTPEGAICGMEHSLSFWGEQIGIFANLIEITGGTGAYENVTGWLIGNPLGRVGASQSVARADGWLCAP